MLIDRQALFSDQQAVTVTAFTTDVYDTGNITPARNLGRADLRAFVAVTEAALAAGAATVTFEFGHADAADGTGFVVLASSAVVPKASLTLGATGFDVPIPDNTKRYLMGRYTVATGPLTAGKFTWALVRGSDYRVAYPDGYAQAF